MTDLGKLVLGLNACLPEDIVILSATQMPDDFHATIDCRGKEYSYQICTLPYQLPMERFYSWHYPYNLDISKMRLGGQLLLGTHDFVSFCNTKKNEEYTDTVRTLISIEIEEVDKGKLCFEIRGTNFLYKMARNIVGLLVYVGRGKMPLEQVTAILKAKDRTQNAITAPAHGLTLNKVFYS